MLSTQNFWEMDDASEVYSSGFLFVVGGGFAWNKRQGVGGLLLFAYG